jgi:hypothetical protein
MRIDGEVVILDEKDLMQMSLSHVTRAQILQNIKTDLDSMIVQASRLIETNQAQERIDLIQQISDQADAWEAKGFPLKGYSVKSIYRKLLILKKSERPTPEALARRQRSDRMQIRNKVLSRNFERLLPLASALYFENAKPNIRLLVDLIREYAMLNEDFYEFASIHRDVLARNLKNAFEQSGFKSLHQFLNHHNAWREKLPTVIGAFTDDMNFMDWIGGDDHKSDVSGVWVYDPVAGKNVMKQVQTWAWIEMKTQRVLARVTKAGPITSEDVIKSVIEVVLKYGLPNCGFIVDNGVGYSEEVKRFFLRLESHKAILKPSKGYTPTNKANLERIFRYWKEEMDAFYNNFVGPDKRLESRHSGLVLSPEPCEISIDEYDRNIEQFLNGFYSSRHRRRIINGKAVNLSIAEMYDQLYQNFTPDFSINGAKIRYALCDEYVKPFDSKIIIKGHTYIETEALPVSFNGQNFKVFYNRFDPSEIDIYALDLLIDRTTGEVWNRGDFVATLKNIRMADNKYKIVAEARKRAQKAHKQLAEAIVGEQVEITGALPVNVGVAGDVHDQRIEFVRDVKAQLGHALSHISIEPISAQQGEIGTPAETATPLVDESDAVSWTIDED